MNTSINLFQLVKSLSAGEKRFFKLFAFKQKGEKNYLKLFEAIEKQSRKPSGVYDEKKIVRQFAKKKFIKQLSVAKNYLYQLILKSLENYHCDESVSIKLQHQLLQIKILYKKGLLDQCESAILKTKQMAHKYEHLLVLADLGELETQLLFRYGYTGKTEMELDVIFREKNTAIEKFKNGSDYSMLISKAGMRFYRKGHVRSAGDTEFYRDIIEHPLLESETRALSDRALASFFKCHQAYCTAHLDYAKARSYSLKNIQLFERNSHRIADNPDYYMGLLNDYIYYCMFLRDFNEIPFYLEKLKSASLFFKADMLDMKNKWNFHIRKVELEMYIESGEFDKGVTLAEKMNNDLENGSMLLNVAEKAPLFYCAAYAFFGVENHSRAKTYLNKIFQENTTQLREDAMGFAKILNLILLFEEDDVEGLDSSIRNTYRFFYRRKHAYKFEFLLLDFIRNETLKIKTKQELINSFEKLKTKLVEISNDPFEKMGAVHFDIVSWLESKIENRPFAELVKEKATKN